MNKEHDDKIISFEKRRSQLSPAKKALLEERLRGKTVIASKKQVIHHCHSEKGKYPLSYSQERLWFWAQLDAKSPAYNIPMGLRLQGSLDNIALEKSINEIVQRHEILRSTFVATEGRPQQIVPAGLFVPLVIMDLCAYSASEGEVKAQQLAAEDARKPFDLVNGPLLRATLLRLREDEQLLLLNIHHIIFDGWSAEVFLKELTELYESYVSGKPSSLPELPIQYADYSIWQREWLQGEVLDEQLVYWKEQLRGAPSLLELPTDRPRPAEQLYEGALSSFVLPEKLSRKLKKMSQAEEATLFMVLLAAFQVLLYRYSGQNDIVVGTPIANRTHEETEGLIGFFVNTLVMRTQIKDNLSFRELLRQVRETALGAYAHQDLPFERLMEELKPERNLSHNLAFNVMFSVHNAPQEELRLADLEISRLSLHTATTKFDLTLSIGESADGLSGTIEYSTGLFDETTIMRMIGHYQTLLESVIADPDQRISNLSILTEDERHQILVEWNATAVEYPKDKCVHELFEAQVERTPDATALVFEDQQLTYRELNERANQLARYLQKWGVGPDNIVGICVERSMEMIVGMLGILKAGAAYLPLDPRYPKEWLALMLEESQISVMLTQSHLRSQLPPTKLHEICIDSDWGAIAKESRQNLSSGVTVTNLAYLIYTSGSTGKPKGVMIEHRSLINLIFWGQTAYALSKHDKVTQIAGFSFDAAVLEIWPTLTIGAGLYFPPDDAIHFSPQRLQEWLVSQKITISYMPTPLAETILLSEWPNDQSLRIFLTGGDRLHLHPSSDLPFAFYDNYGPAENTVVTTFSEIHQTALIDKLPTIGHPISNNQVYLLDARLQPVPVGVAGELCVGGNGLARGYLDQPKLTAERFLPNPFATEPGARMYKTGDLARYLPNGNIEFLGRIDNQIKIRGFRIELGDVESVLRSHSRVKEAVVVVREDKSGDKRLVAYVVFGEGQASITKLYQFMSEKLPAYMVPSGFMKLDRMPLTPNGKVDRKALLALERGEYERDREYVAPRTPVEKILTEIWSELLGVEKVGVYDNFFELGGHSLLATQLASRINEALKVNLDLILLFRNPVISDLGEKIDEIVRTCNTKLKPTILRADRKKYSREK